MENCKPLATPVEVGLKLMKGTEDSMLTRHIISQRLEVCWICRWEHVGPDITLSVSLAARFCSKPTSQHLTIVKRIFRYLRGITHYELLFKRNGSKAIIGYSDVDWGGNTFDCKSTTGYLFQIGGMDITWESKKQSYVALSTADTFDCKSTTGSR